MSNDSAGPAQGRSVSACSPRVVTREALEQSQTFLAEQRFFATCKIGVKLAVRRGELHVEVSLGKGAACRTYQQDDEASMPLREGLIAEVARDLGLARDVDDRVHRAICRALRPHWLRIREEVNRQASDPAALHRAYRRFGASRRGGAVAVLRARVRDLGADALDLIDEAQRAGHREALRDAVASLDLGVDSAVMQPASALQVISEEITRLVLDS